MSSFYFQDATKHTPKKTPFFNTLGGFFITLLILLLGRSFLVSPFRIPSGSMIPTLKVGDHLLASKCSYGLSGYSFFLGGHVSYPIPYMQFASPKPGDILIFAYPRNVKIDYIKRVVAVSGDRVQMIKGQLHINGTQIPLEKLEENYKDFDGKNAIEGTVYRAEIQREGSPFHYRILKQLPFGSAPLDETAAIEVPKDHVFCMGDNWDGSSDSRDTLHLGPVSKKYFLGKALFLLFSIDYENVYWHKPWTWLMIPFKIRFHRIFKGL